MYKLYYASIIIPCNCLFDLGFFLTAKSISFSLPFIDLFVETEIYLCVTYGLVWHPALEQDISSFSLESTPLETRWLFDLLLSCCLFKVAVLVIFYLFVCLYLIWSGFLMIWRLTDPSSDSFFVFFFLVLYVFYIIVLPCSFCLLWFLFLSVFRIIISANTIWLENYDIFTDYLFLAGYLCSCGSSYAVFPDGQFLLDACRGDLYLFICCKGLQR